MLAALAVLTALVAAVDAVLAVFIAALAVSIASSALVLAASAVSIASSALVSAASAVLTALVAAVNAVLTIPIASFDFVLAVLAVLIASSALVSAALAVLIALVTLVLILFIVTFVSFLNSSKEFSIASCPVVILSTTVSSKVSKRSSKSYGTNSKPEASPLIRKIRFEIGVGNEPSKEMFVSIGTLTERVIFSFCSCCCIHILSREAFNLAELNLLFCGNSACWSNGVDLYIVIVCPCGIDILIVNVCSNTV